jgi:DtxR family Mn-dependent transcriptional regulator
MEKRNSNKREVPLTALKAGESGIVKIIRQGQMERGLTRHRRKRHGHLIHGITKDSGFEKRLMDMGLTPGTKVTVVKSAPFHGPFEVLVRGSRLALGRGMAERIFVEKEQ